MIHADLPSPVRERPAVLSVSDNLAVSMIRSQLWEHPDGTFLLVQTKHTTPELDCRVPGGRHLDDRSRLVDGSITIATDQSEVPPKRSSCRHLPYFGLPRGNIVFFTAM
jgi:hypothetical protein